MTLNSFLSISFLEAHTIEISSQQWNKKILLVDARKQKMIAGF